MFFIHDLKLQYQGEVNFFLSELVTFVLQIEKI